MTHRHAVLLAVVGAILLGSALREAYKWWRRRPPPPAVVARYSAGVPLPVTLYAPALAVGALASVRAGEVLDTVACRRSRGVIRRELRLAAEPHRQSVLGEEDVSTAIGRCVNDLLGPGAETVGGQLARVEEVIRHRTRGGPELWPHAIDEWAARAGLPAETVAMLHDTAAAVTTAEEELRRIGILGENEVVPTLLAVHWGPGVHLCRGAVQAGWLDRTRGLNYLRRTGELARRWYPSAGSMLAAQLMPAFLSGDAKAARWARAAAPPLLADPRSPLLTQELTRRRSP
ncbi:DUF1266 domain-containing protein [Paractinoplanes rishiriensis]|uniref:Uncharacterized protein n=1 Tax=Paractinoplanes rishiriensis TaxID=1050105 RepID=A0A919MWL2_9ACTN|nr:DUF1266 domain-containing protein [Actinoplanes rishiriensis]GIE97584.1 hypothetical protein Ari01nite_50490 [Actinoplanes rishiriensis]